MSMKEDNGNPPKRLFYFIKSFLREEFREEIEGDMEERYQDNLEIFGMAKARRIFLFDTIKLLRPSLTRKVGGDHKLNKYGMLQNNLKITWRQMRKQKIFSSIKIGGFGIGLAACLLISLYISNQVSYDKHYEDVDRIYRVVNQWSETGEVGYWTNVHGPLKEVLEENIPEMEKVARVVLWPWGDAGENHIRSTETTYNHFEKGFFFADPELLDILEIPMVYGTTEEALAKPNRMVISKRKADVYFPNENPVGKTIILNDNPESTYVIGGVMEDFPVTSHLKGDFILTLFARKSGPGTSGWCCTNYAMYTKLTDGADKATVEEKTSVLRNSLVMDKLRERGEAGLEEEQKHQSYYLQPVKSIYLNPEGVDDYLTHGSIEMVWIFGAMALIILLLAGVNFVNLSTAHSLLRAKEVGLRKVVGSVRSSLISQYLIESCMYSLLAVLVAVFLAWGALPIFNKLADTSLTIPWTSGWFLSVALVATLAIGLLSGVYPAFVLSGFRPVDALKGNAKGNNSSLLRSGMVVFQFTATVVLIIGALVTHQQFSHIMNKPLGYEKEQVINIVGLNSFEKSSRLAFKEELLKLAFVSSASLSDFLPVEGSLIQNRGYWLEGRKEIDLGFEAARWVIDEDYITTMKMEMERGRNFKSTSVDDQAIIINQQMVAALGIENPIGMQLVDMFDEQYTIVGVVKDFHFESMLGELRPLALVRGNGSSTLSLKIEGNNTKEVLASISNVWDKFSQKQAIRYTFMDQRFEAMYADLQRAKSIFLAFAFLSIVVACLGLLALSIHMMQQRAKEMSVRKVLGASVSRIFLSLTMDFLKLVVIAILIAIPIAWYFVDYLLEGMANRITITWHVFALAGIMAVVIAIGTISFEALKAAMVNPVKQLRSE